jgi:hypothetical protein
MVVAAHLPASLVSRFDGYEEHHHDRHSVSVPS